MKTQFKKHELFQGVGKTLSYFDPAEVEPVVETLEQGVTWYDAEAAAYLKIVSRLSEKCTELEARLAYDAYESKAHVQALNGEIEALENARIYHFYAGAAVAFVVFLAALPFFK